MQRGWHRAVLPCGRSLPCRLPSGGSERLSARRPSSRSNRSTTGTRQEGPLSGRRSLPHRPWPRTGDSAPRSTALAAGAAARPGRAL